VFVCALLLGFAAESAEPAAAEELRVAVISDLNGAFGTIGYHRDLHRAVRRIIELEPDIVLSTGDMIAGQRSSPLPAGRLEAMWRAFHATVTEPLARAGIPLAVTPGNHDASAYEPFTEERNFYRMEWGTRSSELDLVDTGTFPFNYAFQKAGVLFISLDVTTIGAVAEATLRWLDSVLQATAGRYRRTVVFSHVPLWPFASAVADETSLDERLRALLKAGGVDVYLSGHHHAFYPAVADGIVFVSQPCLGAGPRDLIGSVIGSRARGFTFMRIRDEVLQIAALAAPEFDREIDWQTLPPRIDAAGVQLVRADLTQGGARPFRAE
jgi:3',5'-cyclic AMP phosphodiesterase CpdA